MFVIVKRGGPPTDLQPSVLLHWYDTSMSVPTLILVLIPSQIQTSHTRWKTGKTGCTASPSWRGVSSCRPWGRSWWHWQWRMQSRAGDPGGSSSHGLSHSQGSSWREEEEGGKEEGERNQHIYMYTQFTIIFFYTYLIPSMNSRKTLETSPFSVLAMGLWWKQPCSAFRANTLVTCTLRISRRRRLRCYNG